MTSAAVPQAAMRPAATTAAAMQQARDPPAGGSGRRRSLLWPGSRLRRCGSSPGGPLVQGGLRVGRRLQVRLVCETHCLLVLSCVVQAQVQLCTAADCRMTSVLAHARCVRGFVGSRQCRHRDRPGMSCLISELSSVFDGSLPVALAACAARYEVQVQN